MLPIRKILSIVHIDQDTSILMEALEEVFSELNLILLIKMAEIMEQVSSEMLTIKMQVLQVEEVT